MKIRLVPVVLPAICSLLFSQPRGAVYRFDEGSGSIATDSSGSGNNAAVIGAAYVPGVSGTALRFRAGQQDRVLVPQSVFNGFGNTAYFEATIRPTSGTGAETRLFIKRAPFNDWFMGLTPQGQLMACLYTPQRPISGFQDCPQSPNGAVPMNIWSKVAMYYDGSTLHLYVNDREVDSRTRNLTIDWSSNYQSTQVANEVPDGSQYAFAGDIDDVTIAPAKPAASPGPGGGTDQARITVLSALPTVVEAGGRITFRVQSQNIGANRWAPIAGSYRDGAYFMNANVVDPNSASDYVSGTLLALPREVSPGETIEVSGFVVAPTRAGRYVLTFPMLLAGIHRFEGSILNSTVDELNIQARVGFEVSGGSGKPFFTASQVVNAASGASGLSPGALGTIYGSRITSIAGIVAASALPLPTQLAGTSVRIAGISAPILAVANVNGVEQVNFQVPYSLAGRNSVDVVVIAGSVESDPALVQIFDAQPGIFTYGGGRAVATHGNTGVLIEAPSPAFVGEVITLYSTGLGITNPSVGTGNPAPIAEPLARVASQPTVTIAGFLSEVLFAGLAPGFAGLYQVNVRVPSGIGGGLLDIVISVNGRPSLPASTWFARP